MKPGITEISIVPYERGHRQGCVAAFISNRPVFFTEAEIDQFGEWLDHLEGLPEQTPGADASHYFVVLKNKEVIGCGGFGFSASTNQATLAWGLVHHNFHKLSIGSALLVFRLKMIGELYPGASVLLDTTQLSYPFFERHGFIVEKITKDSYGPGMHRYDMKWQKTIP